MVDQDFDIPLAFRSLHSYSPLFAKQKDQQNRTDFSSIVFSDPMDDEFKNLLEDTDSYLKRLDQDATTQVTDQELPVNKDVLPVNGETTRAFSCVTTTPVDDSSAAITTVDIMELDPTAFPQFPAEDGFFQEAVQGEQGDNPQVIMADKNILLSFEQNLIDARTVPKKAAIPEQETRVWTIFEKDDTIVTPDVVPKIQMKTRKDPLSEVTPDKIYSSLVYVVDIDLPVLIGSNVLMAKLSVVDTDFKPVTNDQPVLLNDISGALYQENDGKRFEGKLKFRFNPRLKMTYHQTKKEYHLILDVYHPESQQRPVIQMISPTLRIYGRKLTQKKKRKRSEESVLPLNAPLTKKQKLTQPQQVELFQNRLSQLIQFCKELGQDEKSACLHILQNALEGKK